MNVPLLKKDVASWETGLEMAKDKWVRVPRDGTMFQVMRNGVENPVQGNSMTVSGPQLSFFRGCLIWGAVGACMWAELIHLLVF
jgi:hypothetical protein